MKLTYLDWTVMVIYFVFVPGIGFALKRQMKTSADFFLSGRSIPAWITGLAFTVVGGLLAGFGLLGDKSSLRASLGINVNLGGVW